jgi:hypothetical protein
MVLMLCLRNFCITIQRIVSPCTSQWHGIQTENPFILRSLCLDVSQVHIPECNRRDCNHYYETNCRVLSHRVWLSPSECVFALVERGCSVSTAS